MELYLDTSALVKLYLAEPDHMAVVTAVEHATGMATSLVAYAEARSAFARRNRENSLLDQQHRQIVAAFNTNWPYINRVPVTAPIAYAAGNLAEQYALRGF